ncbi:MAG: ATP-binding cassette domain-containing protein [Dysgonomonas mossii]|uniref:ABC transporter ATP-binding protein n=1 Tax=Dysgonomonas mossii TaxID=163665 RepID=UPI0026EC0D2A|nr:ATP-binding cassette domain-containing protein [Dysgonomonas mossii]MBS5907494.1 ATP-binding cassette domain-containing protein [Dysgonomonas mossii]
MINVNYLSKKYANTVALSNVSFMVPKGSICGLLGPNGAGKTTLIRILTGIIIPDSGQVLINNQPLDKLSVKRIGYLPEERGLYKKMKVGEQAIYLAVLKGLSNQEAEKRLKQWFDKLSISDWWNKKVEILSKGMQQKIQFIISVIHQPDLLILDEPFSGLDPINREELGNEILELNKSGMAIILSTHDMNSVEQFCDEVVLIDKGNILISGKVDEIKQARKKLLYKFCFKQNEELFINQCKLLNAKIVVAEKGDSCFSVKVQFQNESDVESVLSNVLKQIGLTTFQEILPSMHDIFVESITGKSDTNQQ